GIVKLLLEEGVALETKITSRGGTALHLAAELGDLELVKWLVAKKASLKAVDGHGSWTPMQRAVEAGHLEVVKYLLAQGADVQDRALHIAAAGGHLDLTRLLVEQ